MLATITMAEAATQSGNIDRMLEALEELRKNA